MGVYYFLLILASIARTSPVPRNESNILRIGKSRDAGRDGGLNGTDYKAGERQGPVIGKNNPELDWRNYLRLMDGDEGRDLDIDFMGEERVGTTANSIQWLADLYDPLKWSRVPGKLGKDCRKELEFFLESLRDGKLWAAKSE